MTDAVVTAVWRPPFATGAADIRTWPGGATPADIVTGYGAALPNDFGRRGDVVLGGHELRRELWAKIRVKPGQTLSLHYAPARTDNAGSRAVVGLVIAVATVLTAGAALGGAFGGIFTAGSTAARLLAGGITIAGSLLRNAVSTPPVAAAATPDPGGGTTIGAPASLTGNAIGHSAPIPAVIGERDIYPPFVTQPLIERVGEEEVVEVIMALAGNYVLTKPRVGDTSVAAADDITLEYRQGLPSDGPVSLIRRYGATNVVNSEIVPQKTDPDEPSKLENQTTPAESLPVWLGAATASRWDECWLHFTLPGGLAKPSAEAEIQVVPVRLRMRQDDGDDWINLPELHFAGSEVREIRPTIKLTRGSAPEVVPAMPSNRGWLAAYASVPGQDAPNPETDGWEADGSFTDGAGDGALYAGVEGSSNVVRVAIEGTVATLSLDPAVFPEGRWQIELRRGLCFAADDFDLAAYEYDGDVIDFFSYVENEGVYEVARSRETLSDALYLLRCCSVVNEHPVNGGAALRDVTLIAMKARGRSVSSFKIHASSMVDRWDGEAFADFGESARPADHYHAVLRGPLSALPLPAELIDTASLSAWHAANVADDHRCDMIAEGALIADVLINIAGCGYAQPRASEVWGVMRDYDRSGEEPVQIFNVRNSTALTMSKSFTRLPDLLRCAYTDENGQAAEVEVWREGREGTAKPLVEEIRYVGLKRTADVVKRAGFDLKQMELRSAIFSFQASRESVRSTRGSLIGVNHYILDRTHASARVRSIEVDQDDMLTSVTLDGRVTVYNEDDLHDTDDMHAVADMHTIGLKSGMRIRRSDGTFTVHPVSNPTGRSDALTLTTPVELPADERGRRAIRHGNLIDIGATGREERRLIATEITYDKQFRAKFSAVAEAPELHA